MKTFSCLKEPALIPAIALLVAAFATLPPQAMAASDAPAAKPAKAALTVSVTQAVPSEWPLLLSANGNIAAWQEAVIGAEAGGLRTEEVRANVGDRVKKGQVLARLQSDTLRADLDQTRASLKEAEAGLAEATANADRARRLQPSGMITGQQATQWLTAEQTARARLAVFKAKIRADEVRLTQTEIKDLGNQIASAASTTPGGSRAGTRGRRSRSKKTRITSRASRISTRSCSRSCRTTTPRPCSFAPARAPSTTSRFTAAAKRAMKSVDRVA